jgi:hypothetical protein
MRRRELLKAAAVSDRFSGSVGMIRGPYASPWTRPQAVAALQTL